MTQEERRLFLLRALLAEEPRWQDIAIPADAQGQRDLLRSLMNVRPPRAIAPEVLAVQDAYLQEESRRKGIVELSTLNERQSGLYLWQGDITRLACDAIVMRHPVEGAAKYAADIAAPVVINAGDGAHAHPTQGLLDMFTILEHGKQFKGLKMAIIGDILYSRVARSNIAAWTKLGADVHVAGPMTLIPHDIQELGVSVHKRVEDAIEGADVVDVLRIQLERQDKAMFPTPREYARIYGVNEERMKLAKPDCLVMHPGPMNRGLEISWDTGYSDQAVIREQVTNGVAVRMAVLFLTIMGGKPVENAN